MTVPAHRARAKQERKRERLPSGFQSLFHVLACDQLQSLTLDATNKELEALLDISHIRLSDK